MTFTVISSTILNAVDKKFSEKISNQVMKILEDYADTLEQASIGEADLDCSNKISYSNYNMNKRICQRNYKNYKRKIAVDYQHQ